MNTLAAPDELNPGSYAYLQNVRKLLGGRITARAPLGADLLAAPLAHGITCLIRMNDPYLGGPGFVYVIGSSNALFVNNTQVASGLEGCQ